MPRGPVPTLDKAQLQAALKKHGGRVSHVAKEHGLTRQAVYLMIENYGLTRRKETAAERSERCRAAITARWAKDRTPSDQVA